MKYLQLLKRHFDEEARNAGLTLATKSRYQLWIRRFILFAKGSFTNGAAKEFLELKQWSYSSRRQAHYALKFLFIKVLKKDFCCNSHKKKIAKKQRLEYLGFTSRILNLLGLR